VAGRDSIAALFPSELVHRLSSSLDPHARDESAIPSYTHWNPAIRWLMYRRLELMRRMALDALAPSGGGATLLDYGCGVGMLIPVLGPRVETLYACDEQLAPARATTAHFAARNVVCVAPEELDGRIPDASLDAVTAADVLEHVSELSELVALLARKLRPGGALIVSGPTESLAYRFGRLLAGFSGDYHVRSVFDVERDVAGGGFARHALTQIPLLPRLFRITLWRRAT
jgi:2-polyprenyl-3-methyl-5-hydroxy-6-metoxy-1,4-benzoquinol methylase